MFVTHISYRMWQHRWAWFVFWSTSQRCFPGAENQSVVLLVVRASFLACAFPSLGCFSNVPDGFRFSSPSGVRCVFVQETGNQPSVPPVRLARHIHIFPPNIDPTEFCRLLHWPLSSNQYGKLDDPTGVTQEREVGPSSSVHACGCFIASRVQHSPPSSAAMNPKCFTNEYRSQVLCCSLNLDRVAVPLALRFVNLLRSTPSTRYSEYEVLPIK